jgi:hypothetical protein
MSFLKRKEKKGNYFYLGNKTKEEKTRITSGMERKKERK